MWYLVQQPITHSDSSATRDTGEALGLLGRFGANDPLSDGHRILLGDPLSVASEHQPRRNGCDESRYP
jgi:hypothetical protein